MKKPTYRKGIVVGLIVLFFGASVIPGAFSVLHLSKSVPISGNRGFLLIPDSTTKTVGMYDPSDGTYLGDLITDTTHLQTPINAVKGPDGNIYVSDQLADSVFVYSASGTYLSTYADGTDGLNNIRGIDFRGTHLFITSGDAYVAEFSGPHTRLPNFIMDGSDTFDILFLTDGRSLVADIAGVTDNIRLYHVNGTLQSVLFQVSFPEQIQFDSVYPGAFLTTAFSANAIKDFELNGSIVQSTPYGAGRGIFRLGNGNLLATSSAGIQEIQPGTGTVIQTEKTGSGRFIEIFATGTNQPPYTPSNPNPVNNETNVPLDDILSWTGGDPDPGNFVTYNVYFGTTSPPPKVASNQSGTTYNPGTMSLLTPYYWKIVAWDNHGASAAGPIWQFTTRPNHAPNTPKNPVPANSATGVPTNAQLSWTGGDPDPGDLVTYDVYFGTSIPPLKVATNITSSTYPPVGMTYNEQYYWKIIAWDNGGLSATGPLWVFSTINDTTPPTSHHQLVGTMGHNNWYTSCVNITLQATDNVSGVDAIFYKLDSGNWTEYTIPIEVCTDGQHAVNYYSVDNAGNEETPKSVSFKMDKTAPVWTNYTFTALNLLKNKWKCVANVTDATSGIVLVEFFVDDSLVGNATTTPYQFEYKGKPINNSQAIAYDAAGNSAMSPIAVSFEYSNQAQQQSHPSTQTVQKKNI